MPQIIESAGVHVTVDAFVEDPNAVFTVSHFQELFQKLVSALDMKIIAGPNFYEVPIDPVILKKSQETGVFSDEGGLTAVCVISKSHISIHCWPLQAFFSMDVFSCGEYEPEKALSIIKSHMGITLEDVHVLKRHKPLFRSNSTFLE